MSALKRIRRHIPVIVTPRSDAFLNRVFVLFGSAAQRDPQHATHQHRAKQ